MKDHGEILERITVLLDEIKDAQQAVIARDGAWEIRRALLECAQGAIRAKRAAEIRTPWQRRMAS